jgi:hypothetical protein
MLQEMIDEWLAAWTNYHGFATEELVAGTESSVRGRVQRFTVRGDTRDIRQSLAEFDDEVTTWLAGRRRIVWITRPRWTPHFAIECELCADYGDGK